MTWIVRKTRKDETSGYSYHHGKNVWGPWNERITYTSQAKAKAENFIWDKKISSGWDTTAVNENAS